MRFARIDLLFNNAGTTAPPLPLEEECAVCGAQTSVTAGTIFQDTRTPLPVWFRAMWWVTTQKNGASALGLQRVLGLKSYETAWTWLHKLRRAMIRPGRDLLDGRVEVDEGYIGSPEEGLPGRLNLEKTLVVVAAQEDGKGIGRIRMPQIPNASAESLIPSVRDSVVPGSIVHTDGWLGYSPLESNGFHHEGSSGFGTTDPETKIDAQSRCSRSSETIKNHCRRAQDCCWGNICRNAR
jgi:ISXO2-like transposase domain